MKTLHVIVNQPGYLPEDDGTRCDIDSAHAVLVNAINVTHDIVTDGAPATPALAEALATANLAYIGEAVVYLGYAHTIVAAEDAPCDGEGHDSTLLWCDGCGWMADAEDGEG